MDNEIGVKLAEELWGSRFQVIVATHLDKAHHLHNHRIHPQADTHADGKEADNSRPIARKENLCHKSAWEFRAGKENRRTPWLIPALLLPFGNPAEEPPARKPEAGTHAVPGGLGKTG